MKIPVRYNHLGYACDYAKIFFVNPAELPVSGIAVTDCFYRIVKVFEGEEPLAVWEGCLKDGTFGDARLKTTSECKYTGESLWSGDFMCVRESGHYAIQIWQKGVAPQKEKLLFETAPFEISNDWIYRQLLANVKSFYFQRSGVELEPSLAGKWARPAAHLDDRIGFHPSMQRKGEWNAHGGWYDAGDYGKYIVNGGVSVATLLLACELMEPHSSSFAWNAVEGNSLIGTIDDGLKQYSLKEEVRFELEFFLRMQDSDGGVFFKVTPEHWDDFISPKESDSLQKRMILGKSTTSTLNFAGVMAAASRVYRKTDASFAERCLQAARSAYEWAKSRPFVDWPHNTEGSGGYGDDRADDEFFWARAMLYRELRTDELRAELEADMENLPPKAGLDWRDTQNFGWIALALQDFDKALQLKARNTLEKTALEIIERQRDDAYGISVEKFIWGSNGDIANHALTLAIVNTWTNEVGGYSLDFWCREQLNFIYGRNPVDVCFVTGAAWSSPRYPHHRISHSDNVEEPIPGLLVGGINSDRQDMHRAPHYPGELPGFSYTDERCSFASNETAINWNAPLTAVLALLCV